MGDWFLYEFWRFVFVQQEVAKLAMTAIEYPPMQKGASFNLDAVKAKIAAAMIVAAYREDWRKPILIYSGLEKAFLVCLVVANGSAAYAKALWVGAGMDATVVLYTIAYFAVYGFKADSL